MGWNSVNTSAIDIKKVKGQSCEGTYKGKHEITTKIGQQVIWEFAGEDGIGFGIYGFTNLNRAMEQIEPGILVKVTYTGTQNVKTKYGMQDVHQCTVETWVDENEPVKTPFD